MFVNKLNSGFLLGVGWGGVAAAVWQWGCVYVHILQPKKNEKIKIKN